MKTLYIISKGMGKLPDEEIKRREEQNRHPRVSMLEDALAADLLDERYLHHKAPAWRRWLYRRIPTGIAQILEALILQRRYDLVFTQSERVGLPLAILMRILRMKTPHMMIVSRITSMYERKSKMKKRLLKHAEPGIDRFLIWSSVQRKIAIEELGVPASKMKLLKRGTDQRFWHPIPAEEDMICSVGMEMRDYLTLVDALEPVDIPCHIAVGMARGELFETVKRLHNVEDIPSNITVGRKSYLELRELYSRCRFAVVSLLETDSDNGLTAILEAMAMGKPVICSRVEGQVDVIQEGETGIFVPQGDPEAMREAIVELWNDPERAREMGKAAREYVEQHHSMEQFVDAISREAVDVVSERETAPNVAANRVQVEA